TVPGGGIEAEVAGEVGRLEKVLAAHSRSHTLEAEEGRPERFQLHRMAPGGAVQSNRIPCRMLHPQSTAEGPAFAGGARSRESSTFGRRKPGNATISNAALSPAWRSVRCVMWDLGAGGTFPVVGMASLAGGHPPAGILCC